MKNLMALVACVALLGVAGFVDGAGYPRGGGANGTQGTVAGVGSRGFTMTVKDKTISVQCNSMTKFMDDGKQVSGGDVVKEGAEVLVEGGVSGPDQMVANTVSVVHAKHKKK